MYKIILCWRYLHTRYIALASVISVTLGVATLIVVNSVMSGFTYEMQHRIHGILSDIVFDGHGLEGFSDAAWHMQRIREVAGDDIEAMTPTVHVPAMLNYRVQGRWVHRQVNFIGIDPMVPYEPPENPDIVLDTERDTVKESVQKLYDYLGID